MGCSGFATSLMGCYPTSPTTVLGNSGPLWGNTVLTCTSDLQAFLVTVRNKKRVSYTYELTLRVKGEWLAGEEKKKVKAYVDIPEFSVGELDDLQVHYIANSKAHLRLTSKSKQVYNYISRSHDLSVGEVRSVVAVVVTSPQQPKALTDFEVKLNEEKDLTHQDKLKISQDLKLFLQPVREKLLQFEQELRDR
ncbi:hypothetical protein C3L33_05250, partial [Rhododendron williamsianum]